VVKPIPTAKVLIARRDLRIGDRIADADLDWRTWPVSEIKEGWTREDSAPPPPPPAGAAPAAASAPVTVSVSAAPQPGATRQIGADGGVLSLSNAMQTMQGGPKQPFLGAVVREPISAGEPIVARKIVRSGESGYLAVVLAPGKRAMSIPVTVDSGAGGFILPGDRVDVILTRKLETGKPNALVLSQTVLRNMKVLAIDQTTRPEKDAAAVVGGTATLEVTGEEAEALASCKAAGTLSLTLRSYADAQGGRGRNGSPSLSSIGDAGGPPGGGVKVYRNGEVRDEGASAQ
jgi:pilus assembly protein CpaB